MATLREIESQLDWEENNMPWNAEELHFRRMSDDELKRAYLSFRETYRRSHGRDKDRDYDRILLIRDVAKATGREHVLDEALEEERKQRKDGAA